MQSRRLSQQEVALPHGTPEERRKHGACCRILERLWSFETLITLLILIAVSMTAASIWPSNYIYARKGVRSVSLIARKNLILRTIDNLEQIFTSGSQFLNVTTTSFRVAEELGLNILNNTPSQNIAIMSTIFNTPLILSANFGFLDDGALVGITTVDNRSLAYTTDGNGTLVFRELDFRTFSLGKQVFNVTNYDTRKRPWFTVPMERNGTAWAPPFISADVPPKYIFTIGRPFWSLKSNRVIGVLALEIDLNVLSKYVRTLTTLNNTKVLILDSSGALLAGSAGDAYTIVNDTTIRNLGNQSSDPIIRETILQVNERNLIGPQYHTLYEFSYGSGSGKRIVSLRTIEDPYGIQWYAVSNIADIDIMRNVYEANKINAIICAVCFSVSAGIAIIASIIVFRPLRRVCREMDKVADMNFEGRSKIHSFKLFELTEITFALTRMKQGLRNFEKYVPSQIVKAIVRSNKQNSLGVVSRYMSILFVDIKDFTTISEIIAPSDLVLLLSQFFTSMSDIVKANGGAVDKYIGDAIMSLWNAPNTEDDHAYLAVLSAYKMTCKVAQLNSIWVQQHLPVISIRVGVNSGTCLVGNVGSESRMNYTALGDNVNIASRCESLNKRYSTDILITENTYKELKGRFVCRWLSYVSLKGKSLPIHVYQVLCPVEIATDQIIDYATLHNNIKLCVESGEPEQALQICNLLLEQDPNNVAVQDVQAALTRNPENGSSLENIVMYLNEK